MSPVGPADERNDGKKPSLDELRRKLEGQGGKQLWRSLDELGETEEFRKYLDDEFPHRSTLGEFGRRDFLKFMGASVLLAGLAGCRMLPHEKIVPQVIAPENRIPGKPQVYATAMTDRGYGVGVLVTCYEGRPTKIEGNPDHPASLGATDAITQASILSLYDPDRSRYVTYLGEISTWDRFVGAFRDAKAKVGGAGVRILTESVVSPTLASQIRAFLAANPGSGWHQYQPVNRDNARKGATLAFGEDVNAVYHLDKADRIFSLDCDFLAAEPGSVRYARRFADRRRVRKGRTEMNRLYVIEGTSTLTGAMADHRKAVRPSQVEAVARALAGTLGVDAGEARPPDKVPAAWIGAAARDLRAHAGRCVVMAGSQQPPVVHALAHAMNEALGNVGATVEYTEPVEESPTDQGASLATLVADMKADRVSLLIILGANPVYDAPADLAFGEALRRVNLRVHLGRYHDETAQLCDWHVPQTHTIEEWSDTRAFDGTASVTQPLIQPLLGGRSAHELLDAMLGRPRAPHDALRDTWAGRLRSPSFDKDWQIIKHDGVVKNSARPRKAVTVRPGVFGAPGNHPSEGFDVVFRPDPTVWDGRFANNGWLQELPKPLTTLTWDNAALISPASAERLGVDTGDVIELSANGRTARWPVWVLAGHPDDTITAHLGYGRTRAGRVAEGVGFNAYAFRTSAAPDIVTGVRVRKTGGKADLFGTQTHHSLEGSETEQGRDIFRTGAIEEFKTNPSLVEHAEHGLPTIYPPPKDFEEYDGYKWAMVIDTNVCIGCSACTVACQAENNIPVVGKHEVSMGREMHWIRVDRYFEGGLDEPNTYFQPVACMHCEKAPCEPVCPVGATLHSKEGLNQMVYNRCIGTRYCSNNCPYKVRRFNFYKYTAGQPFNAPGNYDEPTLKLMANPGVTVRGRGVMEKCTYCVQRINTTRIKAKEEGREIRDGEVAPACQQVCPTRAITFGSIHDPNSEVSRLKTEPHNYGLLTELNTHPRTSYLARLRNPNPEIES